jgi:hypothetical protein
MKDKRKMGTSKYARGKNRNLTIARIWNETLEKANDLKIKASPFSKPMSIPETLDMGIEELDKKLKKKLKVEF